MKHFLSLVGLCILMSNSSFAANIFWTVATSNSWNTASDWNPATVHPSADDVYTNTTLSISSGAGLNGSADEGTVSCPTGNVIYVDVNATGANDGSSWEDALTDLLSAINTTCPGITEVWVATGTYFPTTTGNRGISFRLRNGRAVYGGFDGTETMRDQRNWVANPTILSGDIGVPGDNSDNSFHVVRNYSFLLNNSAILDGFTITGGNANGSASNTYGGGMFNFQSSPIIANCNFINNSGVNGGGVANQSSAPTYLNCWFTQNTGTAKGGGMYNENGDAIVINSSFNGNFSLNGGGLYASASSSPVITNSSFSGNRASGQGGAVISFTGSAVTLTNCIIWNNQVGASTTALGASVGIASANASAMISYSIIANSGGSGAGWQSGIGTDGGNNLDTNPIFVQNGYPATAPNAIGDLHLQSCSPAIDAGTATNAPDTDIEGNLRPALAGIDMGAYEFMGTITNRVSCYQDADGDGFGNPAAQMYFCVACDAGYVSNNDDCNDANDTAYPDATEVCDGIDNDCNGQIDDLPGSLGNWQLSNIGTATGAANFPACQADPQDVFVLNSTGVSSPTSDNVQLVYQRLCGNSQITARVLTIGGGGWAGVMMRESLSAGSKKVALKTQLGTLIRREIRSVSNGPTSNLQFVRPQHVWLRLTRSGSTLTGYTSMDGQNWSFAFTATIGMEACIYVGVFSESINGVANTTATFDQVSAIGTSSAPLQQQHTGFEESAQNWDIDVYPNPSNGLINLRVLGTSDEPVTVRVLNTLGEQLLYFPELPASELQQSLNLTALPAGVYHLLLETAGQLPLSKRVVLTQD